MHRRRPRCCQAVKIRNGAHMLTAGSLQEVAVPHDVGQAEVCNLHMQLGVQQQVLRLEVPVHHLQTSLGELAHAGTGAAGCRDHQDQDCPGSVECFSADSVGGVRG